MLRSLIPLLAASSLCAEPFPELHNSEPGEPDPIPAAQALEKLRMPEGFQATLFASEPDVQNPIACTWDAKGRLWVAENYTYAEQQKRFDLSMNDRVIILEDKDNDGKAETRKVFTDQVQMLTSVELAPDGLYLMCPPQLLFIPDANHDDVPDGPSQVILDGFDVAKHNYHNFANGLRFGSDGWLYGRCGHSCPARIGKPGTPEKNRIPMEGGIWRYHPQNGVAEALCTGTTNPWGHDWDENGEMFFSNTVIGHIWHMIPGAHFKEPGGDGPNPFVYERMDQIADHYHFETSRTWQDSRDGKANDFGGGHSHVGGMIYQADNWPEKYRGKYFMLNQHGRRVNVERLERQGSGYVAKHEPDMIFSDDPWFRGIDLTTGPDGSVFILDWSDTGECHDHTGVHRESGRIYKVSYGTPKKPELGLLDDLSPAGIERIINHPNAWYYRRMRARLQPGGLGNETEELLYGILRNKNLAEPIRLRSLWLLNSQHAILNDDLIALLSDEHRHLAGWSIRILTDTFALDTVDGTRQNWSQILDAKAFEAILKVAERKDMGITDLVLASTLQRLIPDPQGTPSQRPALAQLLLKKSGYASDPNMPFMLWNAMIPIAQQRPAMAIPLALNQDWPQVTRWATRYYASKASKDPGLLNFLLRPSRYGANRREILLGMADAYAGISSAKMPDDWPAFAKALSDPADKRLALRLSVLFGDTTSIDRLTSTVLDDRADMRKRQAALDSLVDAKAPGILELCEKVIADPAINGNALRGLALSRDIATAKLMLANYPDFFRSNRPALIDTLVARPDWADLLLDGIGSGAIPKSDLSAFSARRIADLNQPALTKKLAVVWGNPRETAEERGKRITGLRETLTPGALADADLSNGRLTFNQSCAACHILYGEGGRLGPDLTGSGRANLDYLLENIISPSTVVTPEYRLTTLKLKDRRILVGNMASKSGTAITLRVPSGDQIVAKEDVESQETTASSLMPEGLLNTLSAAQQRDLIAYLMHPGQVALPEK